MAALIRTVFGGLRRFLRRHRTGRMVSAGIIGLVLWTGATGIASASDAAGRPAKAFADPGEPPPGIFFYRLEPSFYTGFAPRCQDPDRIQIRLGRGNQLRVTVVLSEEIIDTYLADIGARYRIYRELVDRRKITLTQNRGFETFEAIVRRERIAEQVDAKSTATAEAWRRTSLSLLERLNPGRVFHIRIDFDVRMEKWSERLSGCGPKPLTPDERLEIVNRMLPTRLTVTALTPAARGKLRQVRKLNDRFVGEPSPDTREAFLAAARDLFVTVSGGIYPIKDGMLDVYEFTAIYPVGTLNETARYGGQEMPLYPFPGERRLRIHQRTRTIDHIPEAACYGYLPWIPYMHVGDRLHNSFHTLWFHIDTRTNGFIPDGWRDRSSGSRTGGAYPRLWLLSRGPMSHGCTHVNAGHILELRQILPSDEPDMARVKTYRNKSNHFDVFDIDGNGVPEVMGIRYFYAYSLKDKKPHRVRAVNDRKAFYKWLYRGGYRYTADDRLVFERVTTSAFREKTAKKGRTWSHISLYEADYTPETLQFFKTAPIPFVRELRRVGATYEPDRKLLGLD